ncbi:MAG: hypothetical protein HGA93_07125 [Methanothrix sp.]|nr:hypothetical protein [Methanothrix sp.]
MASINLYELLGISKERADEIAKKVRASFSESEGPAEWILRLKDEFGIDQESAEIFSCGWFAGKYAGVSEVFSAVQNEMNKVEKEQTKKAELKQKYNSLDGYA